MYRVIDERATGKTSRLMLLAKETGSKIACSNPWAMRQKAYAYGITGIEFIPYSCLLDGSIDPEDKVMVDEIEEFVREYIDGTLTGYTLSLED